MHPQTWKQALAEQLPSDWAAEIDDFELQIQLRKARKIDEKVFAETRLRRGAYGQRYDNGQRHDGERSRPLRYPCGDLTKGPDTVWDAPGMQRIKIPHGRLSADQLDVLCEVAEEYSDDVLHITTRQDVQLHFVHIEDTPDLMRRLAAVGITTREACGNTVRNVTACAIAGVCRDEAFDVTPHAHAAAFFLLGHPDTQDLGRKFKVAFSGCAGHACGLAAIHDIGCVAKTRVVEGRVERGFSVFVGGGLGPVPQPAQLYEEFVPEGELLPLCQAVCRVFAKYGERKNRARARMKFLLKKTGLEQFRTWVAEERASLTPDPRWTAHLEGDADVVDAVDGEPSSLDESQLSEPGGRLWLQHNVYLQRQSGHAAVTIKLPLGDLSATQGRALAQLARRFARGELVTTVEQNIMLRWVPLADLPELHRLLSEVALGEPGAGRLSDVTSCPGTDTCKLGISSSRGVAAALAAQLDAGSVDEGAAGGLRVKCSGCFNSCGQHHIADIGLLGVSRSVKGQRMPHFQLVVGGQWENNAGAVGLAIGAIPSKLAPQAVELLTRQFHEQREGDETFQQWSRRVGKRELRARVQHLIDAAVSGADPSLFQDWGDPRSYSIGDMGTGECAGEVISPLEFGLVTGEQRVFEAQLALEASEPKGALEKAYRAMVDTARAVVLHAAPGQLLGDDNAVVQAFERQLHETGRFERRFGVHLLRATPEADADVTLAAAQQRVEEAQMFLEAAHEYQSREMNS